MQFVGNLKNERKGIMKKIKKNFVALLSLVLIIVTFCAMVTPMASAATSYPVLSAAKYAEVIAQGTIPVYRDPALRTRGTSSPAKAYNAYADCGDVCRVFGFANGGKSIILAYPTSSGYKTGYCAVGNVLPSSTATESFVSRARITTYKYSSGGSTYGYVAVNDRVYPTGKTVGSYTQLLYPAGKHYKIAWAKTAEFNAAKPVAVSYNPQGYVDRIEALNAPNTFRVVGWCFDRDQSTANLTIHMYVGGPAGSKNAKCYSFTANSYRPDVRNAFPAYSISNYTGFNRTFTIEGLSGSTPIYLYAINKGGGSNVLLGSKTIQIQSKKETVTATKSEFIKEADLKTAASQYGINTRSNAYAALNRINTEYAAKLTSNQKNGTLVFMFEGVGSDSSTAKRQNAMCVVVKAGKIVYINLNSSTLPDYPFNPSKNEGTPMPTLKSGIYTFTTVNHRNSYAALNVNNAKVVRFKSATNFYDSTSAGINIHRKSSDCIAHVNASWVNSAGCQLVGKTGTSSSSEYAKFIQAIGIVNGSANATGRFSNSVSGKYIVDRAFAGNYMRNIGYSNAAIKAIG